MVRSEGEKQTWNLDYIGASTKLALPIRKPVEEHPTGEMAPDELQKTEEQIIRAAKHDVFT